MKKEEIIATMGDAHLRLAYQASVVQLAKEILDEFVDEGEPSPVRDKLAGIAGIMAILHDDLLNLWDATLTVTGTLEFGEEIIFMNKAQEMS